MQIQVIDGGQFALFHRSEKGLEFILYTLCGLNNNPSRLYAGNIQTVVKSYLPFRPNCFGIRGMILLKIPYYVAELKYFIPRTPKSNRKIS